MIRIICWRRNIVECGTAAYEMENYPQALNYLQGAVDIYHPGLIAGGSSLLLV